MSTLLTLIKHHSPFKHGTCERCDSIPGRATHTVEIDGEELELCGYHYGEAKGYVAENTENADQ